jgi:hypothetical protein
VVHTGRHRIAQPPLLTLPTKMTLMKEQETPVEEEEEEEKT